MERSDLALISQEFHVSKFVFIFSSADTYKMLEAYHTHEVEASDWQEAYYIAYAMCPTEEGDILWYAAEFLEEGVCDITSLVTSWIEETFFDTYEVDSVPAVQYSVDEEDYDIPF